MSVRLADSGDAPDIAALYKRTWEDSTTDLELPEGGIPLTTTELIASFLRRGRALIHSSPEGIINGIVLLWRLPDQSGLKVAELGLCAEPRGCGIGEKLLDAAILFCREQGMSLIVLNVFARNPAVHLYSRKDFVESSRRVMPNQRGDKLELIEMRLPL